MSLEKQIQEGIKQAMIAKDKTRLESLRAIKSQILLAKTAEGAKLEEDGSLPDDQILKAIQKLVKQHQESADLYSQNGRPELAEAELAEAKVMEEFLPKQMSAEEIQFLSKPTISPNRQACVCFCRDPEGNYLELVEELAGA